MITSAAQDHDASRWPALPLDAWRATCATLHMWTQIAGKIRLTLTPPVNHWWHSPLYVTARGLTTSPIPYQGKTFEIAFDFIDHQLRIDVSDGKRMALPLAPRTVAAFYHEILETLEGLGIRVRVYRMPMEVPDPIPFDQDTLHGSYDAEHANRFWRILAQTATVMNEVRGRFIGKVSPVHFFWGGFDLAMTWFSGRPAPERSDPIQREAYSHEVISVGFWPGSGPIDRAAFYAYAAPTPEGFSDAKLEPGEAYFHKELGEFLLDYGAVRASRAPKYVLRRFFETAYEAGAELGHWDRAALERPGEHPALH